MISIVLVEPRNSGNIGAIARVMKNFNVADLILVRPRCNHQSKTAKNRAKHANDILKRAKIKEDIPFTKFNTVIATTAIVGNDYNIPRSPLEPSSVAAKIGKKTAILVGRESSGLTNKEIQDSDFVVSIPTSEKYRTMNISHAVGILLYEMSSQKGPKHQQATAKEKGIILKSLDKIFNKLDFSTKEKKETQKKVWKRIIGKSFLTRREAFAVMGFIRKLEAKLR